MSKRILLVLAVAVAMVTVLVDSLPAFAQGQEKCGLGARLSSLTREDIFVNDYPKGGGEFASHTAQAVQEPGTTYGSLFNEDATNCA